MEIYMKKFILLLISGFFINAFALKVNFTVYNDSKNTVSVHSFRGTCDFETKANDINEVTADVNNKLNVLKGKNKFIVPNIGIHYLDNVFTCEEPTFSLEELEEGIYIDLIIDSDLEYQLVNNSTDEILQSGSLK